jgi:type I restriction enzyme S subunit
MAVSEATLKSGIYPRGFARDIEWPCPLVKADELVVLNYGKALRETERRTGQVPVYGTNGRCGWHDTTLAKGPGVILGRKGQGPLFVDFDPIRWNMHRQGDKMPGRKAEIGPANL